jgi:hypothetical protein
LTCTATGIDTTFGAHKSSLHLSPSSVYMTDYNPPDYPPYGYSLADLSPYNYVPTEYVCAIFVALYGLSTCKLISIAIAKLVMMIHVPVIHLGQSIHYRMWWLLPTAVLAGVGEVLGWSARLWSSHNPLLNTPFLMQ